jgi:phi13 family phage major tail protein
MPATPNKVQFGLKNVHYSVVTETQDAQTGEITSTYGAVKAWPGAVNITLDPDSEQNIFYADDMAYYTTNGALVYSGELEMATIPEDVETSVLGHTKDSKGGIAEKDSDVTKYIALLFEFNGDQGATKHALYRVMLGRPSMEGSTTEESVEVKTQTLSFTASARPDDGLCKYKMGPDGDATVYAGWYSAVPTPASGS